VLAVALALLGTTGCGGGNASAQDRVVVGDVLQALQGTVILGGDQSECRLNATPGSGLAIRDPDGVWIVNPRAAPGASSAHKLGFGAQTSV
jgi:hypothetical protein